MEIVETLHNLEKKILLALKEIGNGVTDRVLIEKTNLKEDEVFRAIEWLKEKRLIKVEFIYKDKFKDTMLGEKYAEFHLPEWRILKVLKDSGELEINELLEKAKLDKNEFNAAIGILKRQNLIQFFKGKLNITDLGKERLNKSWFEEDLLKFLKNEKYLDEIPNELQPFVRSLLQRGIIERETEKIRQIYFTDLGRKILPKVKIEEEIELLTPKIIKSKLWVSKNFRKYDIKAPAPEMFIGKKQPYLSFVDEVKKKLVSMGFEEMKGPLVELSFFNDILYMPQDHPAREIHDIFFIKKPCEYGKLDKYKKLVSKIEKVHEDGWETGSTGWGYTFDRRETAKLILRSQTTNVSARKMISKDLKIPGKYFTIDRNFRVDTIDWKHLIEFDQVEGIVLDENITFKELLGVLKMFAREIAGADKYKFIPGYFPFTEPSVELHVYFKDKGWMEIGGAGIFRPEVTLPLGIEVPVIAWGLGIFRLFMTKYGIDDMRQVFSNDLRWLREFR